MKPTVSENKIESIPGVVFFRVVASKVANGLSAAYRFCPVNLLNNEVLPALV